MATGTQKGAREAMLSTIRRALQIPAPLPGSHAASGKHEVSQESPKATTPHTIQSLPVLNGNSWRRWLPPAGDSWDDWAGLFASNAEGLKAEFHLLQSEAELPAALRALRDENGWQRVAVHDGDLTGIATRALELPSLTTKDGYDRDELEKCDAGITLCDALIAQTGSVLLTSQSAGGRTLSVLPPHHVVLARREQLVPDLPAAFELLRARYGEAIPSLVNFVTGPSRTGDIERILVLGAHGPKKLTIFCV